MSDLSTFIRQIDKIPSLPNIYFKITEAVADPRTNAAHLGRIIEKDQALTSRLLRLANSAMYGFPNRIDNVTRAVTMIGFNQLKDLVLALSIKETFKNFSPDSRLTMKNFWEHSIGCGMASRVLAILKGEKNTEAYFVAGFLHDLGRLLLLEHYPGKYSEVCRIAEQENRMTYEVEQQELAFTHADVGGALLNAWNLPSSLVESVGCHHNPTVSVQHRELTATVHVSDIIVHAFEIGFSGERFVPPLNSEAWRQIGLNETILTTAVERIFDQLHNSSAFLHIY